MDTKNLKDTTKGAKKMDVGPSGSKMDTKSEEIYKRRRLDTLTDVEKYRYRSVGPISGFTPPEKDELVTIWYENGQKKSEGYYKEGKKDGLWTFWFENGQIREHERDYITIIQFYGYDITPTNLPYLLLSAARGAPLANDPNDFGDSILWTLDLQNKISGSNLEQMVKPIFSKLIYSAELPVRRYVARVAGSFPEYIDHSVIMSVVLDEHIMDDAETKRSLTNYINNCS